MLHEVQFNLGISISLMIAAALVLHESVPFIRWIGLVLIIAGVILVQQQ